MPIISKDVKVINELGMHVRPAGQLVKTANKFKSKITLQKDDDIVDAKSIMGVMMLGAALGSMIRITADGEDAEQAVNAIYDLFNEGFGEMDNSAGQQGDPK